MKSILTKPNYAEIVNNQICGLVQKSELTNDDLISIIECAGSYLNLKTISNYAKDNTISYNGAKKFRKKITLFGTKFIIDNI